jgi:hypothetical protein
MRRKSKKIKKKKKDKRSGLNYKSGRIAPENLRYKKKKKS